jgi:hypothetical protein
MADDQVPPDLRDAWAEIYVHVSGATSDGDDGSNTADASSAAMLAWLAEQTYQLSLGLADRIEFRKRCEGEVSTLLSSIEILAYLTKLYAATAPHSVEYANAGKYNDAFVAASKAREALHEFITHHDGTPEYPLRATHRLIVDEIDAYAAVCWEHLNSIDTRNIVSDVTVSERAAPAVQAALIRLDVATADLILNLVDTRESDKLLSLFGTYWLENPSTMPDLSMPALVASYFLTVASPLPGPDCLTKAALQLRLLHDLDYSANRNALPTAIHEGGKGLTTIKFTGLDRTIVDRQELDQVVDATTRSFGRVLRPGSETGLRQLLQGNYVELNLMSDAERIAAAKAFVRNNAVSTEVPFDSTGVLAKTMFVFDLVVIYQSSLNLATAVGNGDFVGGVGSLADLVSAGAPALGFFLLMKGKIGDDTAGYFGRIGAAASVASASGGL